MEPVLQSSYLLTRDFKDEIVDDICYTPSYKYESHYHNMPHTLNVPKMFSITKNTVITT